MKGIINNRGSKPTKSVFLRPYLPTGKKLTDTQSGFRAFKKELLENIVVTSKGYEVESEITIRIIRRGYKILEVPIRCGKSPRASRLRSFRDGFRIFATIITTFITSINYPRRRAV